MEKEKKKIVFYLGFPPPVLLYKIAKCFKENNYETILYTMTEEERFNCNFYKEAFDKIVCSNFHFSKQGLRTIPYFIKNIPNLIKFLFQLKTIKPYAVIGMSGNSWQLKLVHKYFFKKYPLIYFPYDILSQYFNSREDALKRGIKSFELDAEKYCLENSDGIIHKGDPQELNFFDGKTLYKADVQKLQLSFLPYCSKEFSVPINNNKLSKKDSEIHLVYPGFLLNNPENIKEISDALNKILNQKIHIHVYGRVTHISKNESDSYFKDLFEKFTKNEYFHLHAPLGEKEIISEISKYDFGFYFIYLFNIPETNFHTSNKIFTFLEAGLPILYNEESKFVDKLLKSYGLKISYNNKDLEKLGKYLEKLNYKKIVENVKKAREDLDMDKNFPRLEKFLEKVVSNKTHLTNSRVL